MDKDQREHYCIQKKITQKPKETNADFEYRQLKQDYFIRDLKRLNIQTVEVDDYGDIPVLLEKVATRYKRSSVFVSGAASEFGRWKSNEAEAYLHGLSASILAEGNRIITGFGIGVGGPIINGALEQLNKAGITISEERLMMRPFPHTVSGRPAIDKPVDWLPPINDKTRWHRNLRFRKQDRQFRKRSWSRGGMKEEFDICVASEVVPIPVGATGYMAETLWKDVDGGFDRYFPMATEAVRESFKAMAKALRHPTN